jgi:Sulfotransferase family
MERYRAAPSATLQHGFPQPPLARRPLRVLCAAARRAWFPTNPVVVETPHTSTFVMCTVPKVACSSFRKLLNTAIRYPDPAAQKTWDQIMDAHLDTYPTVWHYRKRHHNLTETHPSFTLGRNPYVRVLSGFLNKMVVDPNPSEPHDMYTLKSTNRALGKPETFSFAATRKSFAEFLDLLKQAGTVHINDHFQQAVLVCDGGQFQYEYYLRLEDMAEWFPCWEAGLGLGEFTRKGWLVTPEGKAHHVGSEGCWWSPPGVSCTEYYAQATAADGRAQPVRDVVAAAEKHDEHDTEASEKWRAFYTQAMADEVYELFRPDFLAFGYERAVLSA